MKNRENRKDDNSGWETSQSLEEQKQRENAAQDVGFQPGACNIETRWKSLMHLDLRHPPLAHKARLPTRAQRSNCGRKSTWEAGIQVHQAQWGRMKWRVRHKSKQETEVKSYAGGQEASPFSRPVFPGKNFSLEKWKHPWTKIAKNWQVWDSSCAFMQS